MNHLLVTVRAPMLHELRRLNFSQKYRFLNIFFSIFFFFFSFKLLKIILVSKMSSFFSVYFLSFPGIKSASGIFRTDRWEVTTKLRWLTTFKLNWAAYEKLQDIKNINCVNIFYYNHSFWEPTLGTSVIVLGSPFFQLEKLPINYKTLEHIISSFLKILGKRTAGHKNSNFIRVINCSQTDDFLAVFW